MLETPRLRLLAWESTDELLLARLTTDPAVVRYVGDGHRWSAEKVTRVSQDASEHWRANGFGWRPAVEKGSNRAVGFLALNHMGPGIPGLQDDEVEIGWLLVPSAWGRGYASEGARAVSQEAFGRLGAPSVVACLAPENLASARVAQRLGMAHDFDTTGRYGEQVAVYRLNAASRSAADRERRPEA